MNWERIRWLVGGNEWYDDTTTNFLRMIQQNDIEYVENNYVQIQGMNVRQKSFLLSCAFANAINIISFLIKVFAIDPNIIEINGLIVCCRMNSSSTIVKYLIQEHKMDPE